MTTLAPDPATAASTSTSVPEPLVLTLARLDTMTVRELQTFHQQAFAEPTASRHRSWLISRIAWRLQAQAEGGLSERALARAAELASGLPLRERRPGARSGRSAQSASPTLDRLLADPDPSAPVDRVKVVNLPHLNTDALAPGTILRREWRGRMLLVTVLPDGFEHDGAIYRSLSALASTITGTRWNGHVFFGLKKRERAA